MLGRIISCWRRRLNLLLLAVFAAASGGAFAMDSYDPATGILTIPLVIVGNVAYTNVQVFVPLKNVVSVGNINDPNAVPSAADQYSMASGQLIIGALQVGANVYSNVVVAAAMTDVRSVGAVMSVPVAPWMATVNPLPPATVGQAYAANVVAVVAPTSLYTFSGDTLANGARPGGMIIDLNGNLSGTPISTGQTDASGRQVPKTYTFGVCATDTITRATTSPCPQTSITVNPAPVTVTVSKAGTGSGTVASVPAGIACGATCSTSVDSGTQVTLTASAAPGSTFSGWSGACAGTGACVLTVNAAATATATFNLATPQGYTLAGTWSWSGAGANGCHFDDGGAFSMTVTLNGTSFSASNVSAGGVQTRNNDTCAWMSTDTLGGGNGSGTLSGSTVTISFAVQGITSLTFFGTGSISGNSVHIPITRSTGGSGSLDLTLQ